MSRKDKIVKRLLSLPKDFSWQELKVLLNALGYKELKLGKTSGSRVAFYHDELNHIVRLHKPHPESILKKYQLDLIIKELNSKGLLNER